VGLHPLNGPHAVRVDPTPGFVSLKNTNVLQHIGVSVEFGHIKNININPVAEKLYWNSKRNSYTRNLVKAPLWNSALQLSQPV